MEQTKLESLKLVVFLLALLIFLPLVSSANVGVSPARVEFKDVLRNGYAERYLTISVDSPEPVDIELEPRGEIETWINYTQKTFSVSNGEPYYLKISVSPPGNTPNGNYTGFLKILTSSFTEGVADHAVGKIHSSLDLAIKVEVTDVEILDCVASNFQIFSAEEGDDVLLKLNILNKGNVILSPRILSDIWDGDQISVVKREEFNPKGILPTIEETLELRMSSVGLLLGQYWAEVSVIDCLQESLLTFDILEEGALLAKGLLLNIVMKKNAETGETIPFEVNFKNVGEKEVAARFVGKATKNGKITDIFEGEEIIVPIDKIESFNFYFTPQNQGTYVVSGRVFYSGKKTYESSAIVEVTGFSIKPIVIFIYGLFLILILGLIYKIRKERKIYRRKLRSLK